MSDHFATAKVANPDAVPITITITLTVENWKAILDQLPTSYPHWKFAATIRAAIRRISELVSEPLELS